MGKSSGSIWVSLGLRTADFTKGIKKARGQLNGFQKFGQGLKGMFNPLTVGIGIVAGLGIAISGAVKIFNDFQKANSELDAVLGATDAQMESLTKQSKALGASTAFTATEVAGLQKEFAKLGFDPSQIQNMTEATLNLAAAAGVELSEAAQFAGASLNAFGLQSSDAGHITDVMALSFASSALDMEKLSETMKTAAPIARATGVSFEQATAAAGKLADANISGSKAGTDLKNIFSELVKDGKPFQESLEDIATKLNGASTKAEKLAIAEKLVGERAKGSLLILVDQKDALAKLATEFQNTDDDARKMADTMLDNVSGSMTKASSAYEGFILSIEDGNGIISKAMKAIVDGFTESISVLTEFNESDLGIFERIASLVNPYARQLIKAREATKEVKEEIEEVTEVMPDMTSKTEASTTSWNALTKAQQKTAVATRKMREEIAKSSKIELIAPNITGVVDSIRKEIENQQPPKLAIVITPELSLGEGTAENLEMNTLQAGRDAGIALSGALVGAAQEGLVGLGEVLGSGGGAEEFGAVLLNGFSGLLQGFGEQMIQLGLGMIALKAALALGPLGAGLAIAGGVALIAIASSIRGSMSDAGSTGFAAGGLVTGSVFANIGEGRGTTKTNPEVIAPLDKLKSFMPNNGEGGGVFEMEVKGTSLVAVLKRTGKSASFSN